MVCVKNVIKKILIMIGVKHVMQNIFNKILKNGLVEMLILTNLFKKLSYQQIINNYKVLEWIPYDRFYDIEYIAKGGFGKVYKANWIDGWILNWDNKNQNWKRDGYNKFV